VSVSIFLACSETKQAVHVCELSSGWFRGADHPAIVAAFCLAHEGKETRSVSSDGFHDFMEFEVWTPDNVEEQFMAINSAGKAHLPNILSRSRTKWQ